MVDIYRSRRGYNYKCFYWKRNVNVEYTNEELVHKTTPSGIFYAKIVSNKSQDTQDVAGVFRVGNESISIETPDFANIDKDDLVQFDGAIWIVGRVLKEIVQKNAEFSHKTSTKTTIDLYKGK